MCTNSKYQNLTDQLRDIDCCDSLIKLLLQRSKPKRKAKSASPEQLVFDFVEKVTVCRSRDIYQNVKVRIRGYEIGTPNGEHSENDEKPVCVTHISLALPKGQLNNGTRLMDIVQIIRRGDPAGTPFLHQLSIYTNSSPDVAMR